jgi:hypothetical protein
MWKCYSLIFVIDDDEFVRGAQRPRTWVKRFVRVDADAVFRVKEESASVVPERHASVTSHVESRKLWNIPSTLITELRCRCSPYCVPYVQLGWMTTWFRGSCRVEVSRLP